MTATKQRVPPLPKEDWTDDAREVFAFWGEPDAWEKGSSTTIMMAMANHPALAMAYNGFGKQLLLHSLLGPRPREILTLRVAWHLKSTYEWHYHVGYALTLGMTMEEIAATKAGPDWPHWNEADAAVLRATDELLQQNTIADTTWAALERHYDRKQIMEIIFCVGQYVMTSWAIAAMGVPLEPGVDAVGWDLKTASGKVPGMRYKPGETEDWAEKRGYED
jgi:4-carboxymuconolactone decarboxylase